MRKVGYARVSTTNPEQDSSIASQRARLTDYGCDPVFAERESNKGIPKQLGEAMELCQELGPGTQLVITNFDRISRDQDLVIITLLSTLKRAGVVIWELDRNGPIDPDGVETRIFAVLNSAERRKIQEKVASGIKRRKDKGLPIGPPPPPYTRSSCNTKLVPDPRYWAICRQAVGDYADGKLTLAGIHKLFVANNVRIKSRSGVGHWINNPVLRGHLVFSKGYPEPVIIRNAHTPLIDNELHLKIRCRLDFNQDMGPNKPKRDYSIPNSVVRCRHCGLAMHASCDKPTKSRNYPIRRFRCRTAGCAGKGQGSVIDDVVEGKIQDLWSRLMGGEGIANGVGWHEIGFCSACWIEAFSLSGPPAEPKPDTAKTEIALAKAKEYAKADPEDGAHLVAKQEIRLRNQQALLAEWEKFEAEADRIARLVLNKEDWDSIHPLARRRMYKTAGVTVWVDRGKIVGINL